MARVVAVMVAALVAACGASSTPTPAAPAGPSPTAPTSPASPSADPTAGTPPSTPSPPVPPQAIPDVPAGLAPAVVTRTSALPGLPVRIAVDEDGTVRAAGNLVFGREPGPYPYAVFSALVSPSGEVTERAVAHPTLSKEGATDLGFDAGGGVVAACGNPRVPLDELARLGDGEAELWRPFPVGEIAAISVDPDGASYLVVTVYLDERQTNGWTSSVMRVGPSGAVDWTRELAPGGNARGVVAVAIARSAGGDLLVVGAAPGADASGGRAGLLAATSPLGVVRTYTTFDFPGDAVMQDAVAAPAGGVYLATFSNVRVTVGYEQWVALASIAEDGALRWRKVIGKMDAFGWPSRITVDADGNAWIAASGTLAVFRPDGTLAAAAALPESWSIRSIALRDGTPYLGGYRTDDTLPPGSGPEPSLIGFVWQLAPLPAR